jgi:ABC-type lipoprotein export system ATPase subunit
VHLYFLPNDVFSRLEQPKPTYLIGSRGTGKTTLLTALSWKEQLNNPYLSEKLDNAGKRGYI